MATPDDRRYTDQHEWALVQGSDGGATVVRVGITDHAQDALGDIVFVQLPEVGDEVGPGSPIGEVESTKSVSDIYAPVAGTVVAVNTTLADAPETINADASGAGWLVEIAVAGEGGDPYPTLAPWITGHARRCAGGSARPSGASRAPRRSGRGRGCRGGPSPRTCRPGVAGRGGRSRCRIRPG